MTVNVEKLLNTIEEQIHQHVDERYPGYKVRLSQTIERLLLAEQAWQRDHTPVNPEFMKQCQDLGFELVAATSTE